ncbi:MAG: S-adenosyl-l-methionine hydroxide adenosyltransferase family protein [Proteobacteria bacterium]|nr:S-adenosyl-l-methionine hydroxide adenosyltransferase family protein [Pseudomonadota bacterium]
MIAFVLSAPAFGDHPLVLQSDFGEKDGAVAAMRGVAISVSPTIPLYDLTHEIPPFNIWEASFRLVQSAEYWPEGTVFVSVVDPGVGTNRKSVVLKTKTGHYVVTPDNGTLTFIAQKLGIAELREIDEAVNRLKNSEKSYTFHGRDVYAYTGARLAAGKITFEEVGRVLPPEVVSIPFQDAVFSNEEIRGNIPVQDVQFGNVWTNIGRELFQMLNVETGTKLRVRIRNQDEIVLDTSIPYVDTFGGVDIGEPLIYLNSLNSVSLALNQGSFAEAHGIGSGPDWSIQLTHD